MAVRVRVIGAKKLQRALDKAAKQFNPLLRRNLAKAANVVVGESQKQFVGSRTRAEYRISGGRRVRRKQPRPVTAPRNKLAVFEGTYRRQISYKVRGRKRRLVAEIGPVGIRYARVHEFGTHGQRRRPVMGPGLKNATPAVTRILGRTFSAVVR
jgi:hypothetical protein